MFQTLPTGGYLDSQTNMKQESHFGNISTPSSQHTVGTSG